MDSRKAQIKADILPLKNGTNKKKPLTPLEKGIKKEVRKDYDKKFLQKDPHYFKKYRETHKTILQKQEKEYYQLHKELIKFRTNTNYHLREIARKKGLAWGVQEKNRLLRLILGKQTRELLRGGNVSTDKMEIIHDKVRKYHQILTRSLRENGGQ